MTRDETLALFARREEAWRARDVDRLTADHAPDGIVISPAGGVLESREEIARIYRVWFTGFPDLVLTQEELIIDVPRVALICSVAGTHGGEFFGVAPTGRRIESPMVCVYRLTPEGLIAHERRLLDFTGVLVQVGVLRAKPAAGS